MTEPIFFFSWIQLLVSSLLAFCTTALFVKVLFSVFRIKNARIRSFFRFLPFISVYFDTALNQLRLGNWLNPLTCESCLQKVLILLLPREAQAEIALKHMSFAEWFAPQVPEIWLKGAFLSILAMTIGVLTFKLSQLFYSNRALNKLIASASPCLREVTNGALKKKLEKAVLLLSSEIQVPMAARDRFILIPDAFEKELSQQEFETVVAHEWEHLRWKDPYVKLVSKWIAAFFWWIPTKSWLKKLEDDQEEACDLGIASYQLDPQDLATAVVKISGRTKHLREASAPLCRFAASAHSSLRRVRTIFEGPQADRSLIHCLVGMAVGTIIAVSCMLF